MSMFDEEKKNQHHLLVARSRELLSSMKTRRSVRGFSSERIPEEAVINCISIAASAPSGANCQPWSFVLIQDKDTKRIIREKSEEAERDFYTRESTKKWRQDLKPLDTDQSKPFLETAPYLICIFMQKYGLDAEGNKVAHYYPLESVGIAAGFLISSLHQVGFSTLTYTPAPMNFLGQVLQRPKNEKPFLVLVVGYAHKDYEPPKISKKKKWEYLTII